ncbi:hypothetical protein SDC9_100372 [bioreactor metagenome]|uniref:Uncharacterized protein n=1 Tax=bioreactor metagenome TaxID=1076179 RepID=A0A645AVN0_9ZZZZ|nr:DUF6452 family protein [Paludibacter sp.]
MSKQKFYIFAFLIIAFMVNSCAQDETCRENKNIKLNVGFFSAGTTTSLSIDSLTAFGLNKDSLLYNVNKNINKINLPLNKKEDVSIFVVRFNTTQDTVWVLHTNYDYFISYECGSVITHKIDTVITTNHYIESVKIINHDVNTTDVQHLQIFH